MAIFIIIILFSGLYSRKSKKSKYNKKLDSGRVKRTSINLIAAKTCSGSELSITFDNGFIYIK